MARLLSWVENGSLEGQQALATLFPHTGKAHIIGITGSPGAGKSTLLNQLAREFRDRDGQVAIVAVDPSSPFTGGALLGDRLRMRDLVTDPHIFIRSMASRGHPGGVAHATRDVVTVLDALGFPLILVETVGAGQAQVEVARVVHTVVLVEAPGMGDEIQALKAGLMEIADIIVVNKADRPEAKQTVKSLQSLRTSLPAGHHGFGTGISVEEAPVVPVGWEVPILQTIALENEGVFELTNAIKQHYDYLKNSGRWDLLLRQHAEAEVEAWLQRHFQQLLNQKIGDTGYKALVDAVVRHEIDPAKAAAQLLEAVTRPVSKA
ncbi:MAG: methylmalonyl Co-A mutase-associated GTPase MeaB [Anaerolineae bacterium]|nr:methylmalonyl Co-A mutase-associated GTPase MeaB [Anaerolineae bacterium]